MDKGLRFANEPEALVKICHRSNSNNCPRFRLYEFDLGSNCARQPGKHCKHIDTEKLRIVTKKTTSGSPFLLDSRYARYVATRFMASVHVDGQRRRRVGRGGGVRHSSLEAAGAVWSCRGRPNRKKKSFHRNKQKKKNRQWLDGLAALSDLTFPSIIGLVTR